MEPKYGRIAELLRNNGIDGAIVSSPENFHYAAGFAGHQHTVSRQPGMAFAVLGADGEAVPRLGTMDFEVPAFEEKGHNFIVKKYDTWVCVRQWGDITGGLISPDPDARQSSMDVLTETVNEMGLADKTIGVELAYLPVDYYAALTERLPKAKFADVSGLFVYARSVKTAEEAAMFRRLCRVACEALNEAAAAVAPGVSEQDLAEIFRARVTSHRGCVPSSWSMFAAGANGARLSLPGENKISRGDVVKFDGGVNAGFDFYTTDTSRSWITAGADPLLHKLKDRLYEAQRKMIEAAKSGVPINELFKTGYSHVREMFPAYRRGHMGHSISMGPATAEAPYITAGETRRLEPGMVLAIEAPCYILNIGGFNIEDMVLITDDGAEILTSGAPHYLDRRA